MYIALDKEKNRIDAYNADKNQEYYCPVCGGKVIPKQGDYNTWHFAHVSACVDKWTYDMSEWHQQWQRYYPVNSTEVVITQNGVSHRADVVVGRYVIEFQHSPLSSSEFMERNNFYVSAGYKVIWLFDVRHLYGDTINFLNNDTEDKFIWKYPMKTLSPIIPQKWKNGAILFEFADNLEDFAESEEVSPLTPWIAKVTWAIESEDGDYADYKRFAIDNKSFDLTKEEDLDTIFMNKWQRFDVYLQKNRPWLKKCGRVRGNPPDYYRCEITKRLHNDDCNYCKYCLIREFRKSTSFKKGGLFYYCCYPRIVSNEENPDGGFIVETINL